jgi:hypothetical protein
MPVGFPGVEEPRPELSSFSKISLEARPKLPYRSSGDEAEDIVRLGLAHQLSNQVGANLGIGIAESLSEFVESHLGIPEKIRMSFRIHEKLRRGGIEHRGRLANLEAKSLPRV